MTYLQKHKIPAIQYTGDNDKEIMDFIREHSVKCTVNKADCTVYINFIEPPATIQTGEWLVLERNDLRTYSADYVKEYYEEVKDEDKQAAQETNARRQSRNKDYYSPGI